MTLKNEVVVFTGTLSCMTRKQAQATVFALGGKSKNTITQDTTYLVIGNWQVNLLKEQHKSKKIIEANRLKKSGQIIKCINEREFIEMITQHFQLLLKNLDKGRNL